MIRLSDLIGQQAVALATAERTGTVSGVVLTGNQIVVVDLGGSMIPASAVRTFEGDVLTYDAAAAAPSDRPSMNPIGMRVLDAEGDERGTISDLEISAGGSVESIVLDNGDHIVGSRLHAIGSYAAIIAAELPPPVGPPVQPLSRPPTYPNQPV